MVGGDKHIAGAHGESVSDFAIDFEVGLLGVGNRAVRIDQAVSSGAGGRARTGNELGGHLTSSNQTWQPPWKAGPTGPGVNWFKTQVAIFRTLTNTPYGFSGKVHGPLRLGNKQEGEIVAVVEYSEARADHGLAIRRPCKPDARLERRCSGD